MMRNLLSSVLMWLVSRIGYRAQAWPTGNRPDIIKKFTSMCKSFFGDGLKDGASPPLVHLAIPRARPGQPVAPVGSAVDRRRSFARVDVGGGVLPPPGRQVLPVPDIHAVQVPDPPFPDRRDQGPRIPGVRQKDRSRARVPPDPGEGIHVLRGDGSVHVVQRVGVEVPQGAVPKRSE